MNVHVVCDIFTLHNPHRAPVRHLWNATYKPFQKKNRGMGFKRMKMDVVVDWQFARFTWSDLIKLISCPVSCVAESRSHEEGVHHHIINLQKNLIERWICTNGWVTAKNSSEKILVLKWKVKEREWDRSWHCVLVTARIAECWTDWDPAMPLWDKYSTKLY